MEEEEERAKVRTVHRLHRSKHNAFTCLDCVGRGESPSRILGFPLCPPVAACEARAGARLSILARGLTFHQIQSLLWFLDGSSERTYAFFYAIVLQQREAVEEAAIQSAIVLHEEKKYYPSAEEVRTPRTAHGPPPLPVSGVSAGHGVPRVACEPAGGKLQQTSASCVVSSWS